MDWQPVQGLGLPEESWDRLEQTPCDPELQEVNIDE